MVANLGILASLLKNERLEGIDFEALASRTTNFSGSDLKNLAVSAALASLKDALGKHTHPSRQGETRRDSEHYVNDSESEDEDDDFDTEPRVIRPYHFEMAFERVSATVSQDMDSVQQLRRWSEKYSGKKQTPAAEKRPSFTSLPSRSNGFDVKGAEIYESAFSSVGSVNGMSDASDSSLMMLDLNNLLERRGSKVKSNLKTV